MSNTSTSGFGIPNVCERYFWASYHIFVSLSSLVGDTLILFASFQKNVFKVNKFIVSVMQHLAVCDLGTVITTAVPGAISLVADSWVLGSVLCRARVYTFYLFIYPVNGYLTAVLTASKLLVLWFPLKAANLSRSTAHLVCGIVWTFSVALTALSQVLRKEEDVVFDYLYYNCRSTFDEAASRKILFLAGIIVGVVPCLIVVSTTIPTLKYLVGAMKSARQARGNLPWQGALTVSLTALVYFISTLPMVAYALMSPFLSPGPMAIYQGQYIRITYFLVLINTMANFHIYTMTVRGFREFLFSRVSLHVFNQPTGNGTEKSLRTSKNIISTGL